MRGSIKTVFRSGGDDLSDAAISIYHYMNIRLSRGRQHSRCAEIFVWRAGNITLCDGMSSIKPSHTEYVSFRKRWIKYVRRGCFGHYGDVSATMIKGSQNKRKARYARRATLLRTKERDIMNYGFVDCSHRLWIRSVSTAAIHETYGQKKSLQSRKTTRKHPCGRWRIRTADPLLVRQML